MKSTIAWIATAVASLFSFSPLSSIEMILEEGSEGFVLEVQPEDSFRNVIESISQQIDTSLLRQMESCESKECVEAEFNSHLKAFRMDLMLAGGEIIAKVSKAVKNAPRNYYTPLTASESEDIAYILRTLATNTLLKINSYKSSIKKAGDRVEHLHPLKFLQCIFGNEELKVHIRNIYGRSWVWKEFLGGITRSLKDESAVDNVKIEYVQDFANQIKIDANLIIPSIQGQRWEELVDILIATVPRSGNYDRYNQ